MYDRDYVDQVAVKIDKVVREQIHKILEEEIPALIKSEVDRNVSARFRELARVNTVLLEKEIK